MISINNLSMPENVHKQLKSHLFPEDGCEAAGILLCSRTFGTNPKIIVHKVILVPHDECKNRTPVSISWPGKYIEEAIDVGEGSESIIILAHSHPGGHFDFSEVDNKSDEITISSLFNAYGKLHGSAIMTPCGAIKTRLYSSDMKHEIIDVVSVAGDDIKYWWADSKGLPSKRPPAYSEEMTSELGRLTATVIGVSGTGSIVAEQVARMGFGNVVLIDFDCIEEKNLNRILNSTYSDSLARRSKVDMVASAITQYRGEGVAIPIASSITNSDAAIYASESDVIFCCTDTLESRYVADIISSSFLVPLFDVGVTIPTRKLNNGSMAIAEACGRIDYIQPGGSTLSDRNVYCSERLRVEYLRSSDPGSYREELNQGYIKGMIEEAPSVITLNMIAAAHCVHEFLIRAYPYRQESNSRYARKKFYLSECEEEHSSEDSFEKSDNEWFCRGNDLFKLPLFKNKSIGVAA